MAKGIIYFQILYSLIKAITCLGWGGTWLRVSAQRVMILPLPPMLFISLEPQFIVVNLGSESCL